MPQTTVNTYPSTAAEWEAKRMAALAVIRESMRRSGVAPTYAEIAEQIEVGDQTARTLVNALCALGLIERKPGKIRSISVTRRGANLLAEQRKVAA